MLASCAYAEPSRTSRCAAFLAWLWSLNRAPKDHIDKMISQTKISGIPPILGLETRMCDPDVFTILLYNVPIYHDIPYYGSLYTIY